MVLGPSILVRESGLIEKRLQLVGGVFAPASAAMDTALSVETEEPNSEESRAHAAG
jgi:hypothetical protein